MPLQLLLEKRRKPSPACPQNGTMGKPEKASVSPTPPAPMFGKLHLETLRRHEPFRDFTFRRRGPDGTKWLQSTGVPVFDASGQFTGYRGTGTDVTARVEAERRAELLAAAIENMSEMFALWDTDDRLVVCNARFRDINAAITESLEPGTSFEDHIRAALDARLYPQAYGNEQQWFAQRMAQHNHPVEPFELEREGQGWLLVAEHRLPDGCTATLSTDITDRKHHELELAQHKADLERIVGERTAHLHAANEEIRRFTYIVFPTTCGPHSLASLVLPTSLHVIAVR